MCDEKKDEQECSFRGITPKIKEDRRELQIKLLKDSIVHIFCGLVRCRGTQWCEKYIPNIITGRINIITKMFYNMSSSIYADEPTFRLLLPVNEALMDTENEWL